MEDPAGIGGTLTYSPWDDVGTRYPEWNVRFTDLRGLPELMCWDTRVILLEESRGIAQKRSDLGHAIAHLDLEHRGDTFNMKHEEAASRYAARRLGACAAPLFPTCAAAQGDRRRSSAKDRQHRPTL